MKQLLTNAPILRNTNPNMDFVVCTDACKEGLGGVISQEGFVVCYESQKLKEHERNYATHDLELAAIVHALRKWRHYLMGKKFELRTDHNGLKYLFDQPTLNARKIRWLEFLCEYDFDIKHIKGKETRWLMHLAENCMNYMLQPLAYTGLTYRIEFWKLQMLIYSTETW